MGYTYVMSDIHGMGALLEKMPEYVGFMKSLPFYKKLKLEDSDLGYLYGGPEEGNTGICLHCGSCPDFCYPGIPKGGGKDLAQSGRETH